MTDLVFGEWLPDQNATENPGVIDALNVIALTPTSYGSVRALTELYNALGARCQGAGAFRGTDGTVVNVAFDATKAYRLDAGVWTDISRLLGGAYAVQAEDMVRCTQFGDLIISVNGNDAPQAYDISLAGNFAALGGSPPVARDVATIRDFVEFGGILTAENKVVWSGLNDPDFYTAGQNQSDEQELPEGGQVQRIVGGEFGSVIMESAIYRQTYIGAPDVFQFDKMAAKVGTCAPGSVSTYRQNTFMLDWDGFYMLVGGQELVPIGDQKLDTYFWDRVNQSYLYRIVSTIDPLKKRYVVAYPTEDSVDGTPDEILFYPWELGRWSRASIDVEMLWPHLSNQGYNWDTIDTVIGNTDATSLSVDTALFGGTGQATIAAFSTNHKLATFTGATLEALIETLEAQLSPHMRSLITEIWPEGAGSSMSLSAAIGYRNIPNEAVTWTSYVDQNAYGFCPMGVDARYLRARLKVAAGGTWDHLRGLNLKALASGVY